MFPFNRCVRLLPPSLQWVPWPPLAGALRLPVLCRVHPASKPGNYSRSLHRPLDRDRRHKRWV